MSKGRARGFTCYDIRPSSGVQCGKSDSQGVSGPRNALNCQVKGQISNVPQPPARHKNIKVCIMGGAFVAGKLLDGLLKLFLSGVINTVQIARSKRERGNPGGQWFCCDRHNMRNPPLAVSNEI